MQPRHSTSSMTNGKSHSRLVCPEASCSSYRGFLEQILSRKGVSPKDIVSYQHVAWPYIVKYGLVNAWSTHCRTLISMHWRSWSWLAGLLKYSISILGGCQVPRKYLTGKASRRFHWESKKILENQDWLYSRTEEARSDLILVRSPCGFSVPSFPIHFDKDVATGFPKRHMSNFVLRKDTYSLSAHGFPIDICIQSHLQSTKGN